MNFQDLHELLRAELVRRIAEGKLTGTRIAQQTGFRQAHISNFLNRKRALSLEGLDRVLASQDLMIDQLLPVDLTAAAQRSSTIYAEATVPEISELRETVEMVPVVSASSAAYEPQIHPASVIETLPVGSARLLEQRSRPSRRCIAWHRFVCLRCDAQQASAMHPILAPGNIAVIDRHYNSLASYHANLPTLFAVRYGSGLLLRYAEFDDGRLILRPSSASCLVQLIVVGAGEVPADYIVGRVCMTFQEL